MQIAGYSEIAIGLIPYSIIPVLLISLMIGWFLKSININSYWRALIYATTGTSVAIAYFDPTTFGQGGRYNPILIEDTLQAIIDRPMPAMVALTFIVFIYLYLLFISVIRPNKIIFKILAIIAITIVIIMIPLALRSIG